MERFGARPTAPLETCLAEVDQSNIYVGIVAFRLGSVDAESGKSYTQLEYERAHQVGKPVLIYLADERAAIVPFADIDVDNPQRERLVAFKQTLRERHTVSTFSTADDLAEKIKSDFAKLLQPKASEPHVAPGAEFEPTVALVQRFMLVPKTVLGREIRLRVKMEGTPYPAARALCKAFNLDYGNTVGARIKVVQPNDGDTKKFRELYATGPRVGRFLELVKAAIEVDLHAELQFSEEDVAGVRAVFFGYSTYDDPSDYTDPSETYVPSEGKALLLFSKTAASSQAV